MSDIVTVRDAGDAFMRSGDYKSANAQYYAAWDAYASQRKQVSEVGDVQEFDDQHSPEDAFWLLISGVNAQFCLGEFEAAYDTGVTAFELFSEIGFVAGNPFFHLRMGQVCFEIEVPEDRDQTSPSIESLARALICGGIEIFNNEDPKYLHPVLEVLRPPVGFDSWKSAVGQGCSVDQLNGAKGFLAEVFESKYGSPPPYPEPSEP